MHEVKCLLIGPTVVNIQFYPTCFSFADVTVGPGPKKPERASSECKVQRVRPSHVTVVARTRPGPEVPVTGGTNQGPAYYQECVSLFGKKVFMKPVNE